MEKTNVPGLFKDRKTIINTNEGDFNRIKATRDKAKELLRMKLDIAILQEQVQRLTARLDGATAESAFHRGILKHE